MGLYQRVISYTVYWRFLILRRAPNTHRLDFIVYHVGGK